MKKVESIWAELSAKQVENTQEVELTEEVKIELASDDVLWYNRETENVLNKLKPSDKLESIVKSMSGDISDAEKFLSEFESEMKKRKGKLEELGFNTSQDKVYSYSEGAIKVLNREISSGKKILNALRKALN